jgi:hypothetical protein
MDAEKPVDRLKKEVVWPYYRSSQDISDDVVVCVNDVGGRGGSGGVRVNDWFK